MMEVSLSDREIRDRVDYLTSFIEMELNDGKPEYVVRAERLEIKVLEWILNDD